MTIPSSTKGGVAHVSLLPRVAAVAIATLATGLALDRPAMADDPFQVVSVAGQLECGDFSQPEVYGGDVKVSGPGEYFVDIGPGFESEVKITLLTNTTLRFELSGGSTDLVDVVVVKGAKDAQQYAYADAASGGFPEDEGGALTTASNQKIQNVTVCSDGETTEFPDVPLPSCNDFDNQSDGFDCSPEDNAINAIIFKFATTGCTSAEDDDDRVCPADEVEKGQSFYCQCGDAETFTVDGELELPPGAVLDEQNAIGVLSINPTCFVWSYSGGKKKCVNP